MRTQNQFVFLSGPEAFIICGTYKNCTKLAPRLLPRTKVLSPTPNVSYQNIIGGDWLYVSYKCYLSQHKRLKAEALQRHYHREFVMSNRADIADFIKIGDTTFAGTVTGNCVIYEEGYTTEQQLHNANEYMRCVDFSGDTYATSTSRCGKLWRRSEELGLLHLDLLKQLHNSYKTIRFNESGNRLFGGLYTSKDRRALREIDLER